MHCPHYVQEAAFEQIYLCVTKTFQVETQKVCLKAVGHLLFPAEIIFHTYVKSYLWWENTEIYEI